MAPTESTPPSAETLPGGAASGESLAPGSRDAVAAPAPAPGSGSLPSAGNGRGRAVGTGRAPRPGWWRTAARPALAPLAAGLLTLAGLAGWTAAGQAGAPAQVTVSGGTVFLPVLEGGLSTAAFFDVENTGGSADRLVEVRTPAGETMFSDRELSPGSGRMVMIPEITVPAGESLQMSPFTPNVMLTLDRPLVAGERIDFVLTFRQSGEVPVTAVVTPPGR